MSEPELTPTEEQIRALLADARLDEPMPADVAARLEGVLADLGDETVPASVAPLPDHAARHRRRLRNLVLAAAAVVVVGVGSTQIDLPGGGDADSGTAAHDQSDALRSESGGDAAASAPAPGPLVLHSDTFERQVRRYALLQRRLASLDLSALRDDSSAPAAPDSTGPAGSAETGAGAALESRAEGYAARCAAGGLGRGRKVPARYDGQAAVLVVRPPEAGERRVDLYLCGAGGPTRSTTVPAP